MNKKTLDINLWMPYIQIVKQDRSYADASIRILHRLESDILVKGWLQTLKTGSGDPAW